MLDAAGLLVNDALEAAATEDRLEAASCDDVLETIAMLDELLVAAA